MLCLDGESVFRNMKVSSGGFLALKPFDLERCEESLDDSS